MNAVAVILLALPNDRRNSGNLSPSLHIFSSSQLGSICGRCQRQGGEKTRSLCTYALRTLVGPALPPLSPLNDRNQPFHSEVLMPGNRSPQESGPCFNQWVLHKLTHEEQKRNEG